MYVCVCGMYIHTYIHTYIHIDVLYTHVLMYMYVCTKHHVYTYSAFWVVLVYIHMYLCLLGKESLCESELPPVDSCTFVEVSVPSFSD